MGKSNNKKVVKEARSVLTSALSNLLESERERKFKYKVGGGPKSRKTFCNKFNLVEPTVAHIETGRLLGLKFEQLRVYLAAVRGRDDTEFLESFKKVYTGLRELDSLLTKL
jgi:hypothetical protein